MPTCGMPRVGGEEPFLWIFPNIVLTTRGGIVKLIFVYSIRSAGMSTFFPLAFKEAAT
jgi:hypothetical protein